MSTSTKLSASQKGLPVHQAGLAPILIVILIAALVGGYLLYQNQAQPTTIQQTTKPSSTPDASLAPTGVGQTANPNCYFGKVICIKNPCNPILHCDNQLPAPVSLARDDLAKQLKVSVMDVVVVRREEIQWTNGSLGCPEPGKVYTQAIVPGYKVIFEFNQKQYEYHTNKNNRFVTCKSK